MRPNAKKACKSVFAIDVDQHNHARLALDNMATYLPQFTNARTPKEKGGEMDTTIMHGDARIENFFFDPFLIIDFQLSREAQAEQDLGYFIGTSLPEPLAIKYECAVLRKYYNAMVAAGVEGYSFWECCFNVQNYTTAYLMNLSVTIDSEKSLHDILIGDKISGGTRAADSFKMMLRTSLSAAERWQANNHFQFFVDRNKGKGKGEEWDMSTPTEAEMRQLLPSHVVEYIDQNGQSESDKEVERMVAEAGIVCREPRSVGSSAGAGAAPVVLRTEPDADPNAMV